MNITFRRDILFWFSSQIHSFSLKRWSTHFWRPSLVCGNCRIWEGILWGIIIQTGFRVFFTLGLLWPEMHSASPCFLECVQWKTISHQSLSEHVEGDAGKCPHPWKAQPCGHESCKVSTYVYNTCSFRCGVISQNSTCWLSTKCKTKFFSGNIDFID